MGRRGGGGGWEDVGGHEALAAQPQGSGAGDHHRPAALGQVTMPAAQPGIYSTPRGNRLALTWRQRIVAGFVLGGVWRMQREALARRSTVMERVPPRLRVGLLGAARRAVCLLPGRTPPPGELMATLGLLLRQGGLECLRQATGALPRALP